MDVFTHFREENCEDEKKNTKNNVNLAALGREIASNRRHVLMGWDSHCSFAAPCADRRGFVLLFISMVRARLDSVGR